MVTFRAIDAIPRRVVVVATAIAAAVVLPAGPVAADEEPPVIADPSAAPANLPPDGGTITISADVTDVDGVASVFATLSSSDGFTDSVTLLPAGPTTYGRTYGIPGNASNDPVSWTIEIWAEDGVGRQTSAFTGGVEVAGQPPFDEPPIVWDPSVSPTSLPSAGGAVTIAVSASDLRGITASAAAITASDGTASFVDLQPISADRFEGTFEAPANPSTEPVTYTVTASAQDDIGQETRIDAGTFVVAGQPAAPASRLTVSSRLVLFRQVPAGVTARRAVVLRNAGATGGPIQVTVSVTGTEFTALGSPSLSIAPGDTATLDVTYTPTGPGLDLGRLTIRRSDAGQRPLGVILVGRGVGRR